MFKKSKYANAIEANHQKNTIQNAVPELQQLLTHILKTVQAHPDVSSYGFTKELYDLYDQHSTNVHIFSKLMTWLIGEVVIPDNSPASGFRKPETAALDFAVYYFLALYCKRKGKSVHALLSLESLIGKFGLLFSHFSLSIEVKSWFERRIDHLDEAYRCDKQMIALLDIHVNAGVYNSFASSVCQRLEKEVESKRKGQSIYYWKDPDERLIDWHNAISYMPTVIEQWKQVWKNPDGYGKHYFIQGKLWMYSLDLQPLSREQKLGRLADARKNFRIAIACENPDNSDYITRCSEYEKYARECNIFEAEINQSQDHIPKRSISVFFGSFPNTRSDICKPNEDFCIADKDAGIFLVADGVTRPHEEYVKNANSISAECAHLLCSTVHQSLLHSTSDIPESILNAMLEGNRAIRPLRFYKQTDFIPCSTFLCAVLRESTLYYSNCCDTVAYLVRHGVKIQLTEIYNPPEILLGYTKEQVYAKLHNNIQEIHGFGIFNGDPEIQDFLHISHINVEKGDRIILASDGLASFLRFTRADLLCEYTLEQMLEESVTFDSPPFQKYGDDKTCILIDI